MSETYAGGDAYARDDAYAGDDVHASGRGSGRGAASGRGGAERTGAGGLIVAIVALFSTAVVIAGLFYATGIGERRNVRLAQGDCALVPSLNQTGLDCTTEQQLAGQYTQMIGPAGQQMNTYVAAYAASELHNLAAAKGALTAEVALENSLDANLKQFTFPAVFASASNKLIRDNEALAKLTAKQAQSSSLVQLRSFDGQVQAAINTDRADLTLVGKDLAKPVTPSEYS